MCKRSQQIIKSWYQTYFIVKSRKKAILGLKRNNRVFTIPLVSSPKQLNIAVSSQKKRDSRPIQSPLYTAYYSWRQMGCNLVSILFLATTSLLGPVRLGEKVRGMRMMWGIKIRIPITLPSPPLPLPSPSPSPSLSLIWANKNHCSSGQKRRHEEEKRTFLCLPCLFTLVLGEWNFTHVRGVFGLIYPRPGKDKWLSTNIEKNMAKPYLTLFLY